MLVEDLQLLQCVQCQSDLELLRGEPRKGQVKNGLLACTQCGHLYPVLDEVGLFFEKGELGQYLSQQERAALLGLGFEEALRGGQSSQSKESAAQVAVAKNWEYQWEHAFPYGLEELESDTLYGEELFWRFIPVEPKSITGKKVFVACGGRGREAFHLAKQKPKRLIVNEIGTEIYSIGRLFEGAREKPLLLRCDVTRHPLRPQAVDMAICDHALQHIPDHKLAFRRLTDAVLPGGRVAICVYSRENNAIMTHGIEPMKKFFHRLPLKAQRAISWPMAAGVYGAIHGVYKPASRLSKKVAGRIPLYEHMMFWSTHPFDMVWSSCFDLVHAPVSYHFSRQEVLSLARDNNLEPVTVVNTHGTMWSFIGKKPGPQPRKN